jgi:hypothetical protein
MQRCWLTVCCFWLIASPAFAVSLTGYYKLDDATPTTAAATIGANGTYIGGFVAGDLGQAGSPGDPMGSSVRFQTTGTLNRRIEVPSRGGLTDGTNLSMSMWVQFDAAAFNRDVALFNNDTTFTASNLNIFRDDVNAGNAANVDTIAAIVGGDPRATSATNSASSANLSGWHLISVSYDTGTDSTRIFIDGVRSSFQTANNNTTLNTNTIALGNIRGTAASAHANQLGGLMDEVGFWDRALTAPEQAALFFLNTNPELKFDAAGVATLLDFYEDGAVGDTLSLGGREFLIVPDVTEFSGLAGQSVLVGNQLVLGLDVSGTGGIVLQAIPEPTTIAIWLTLFVAACGFFVRRRC